MGLYFQLPPVFSFFYELYLFRLRVDLSFGDDQMASGSSRGRETFELALAALGLMRREGLSLAQASQRVGLRPEAVIRNVRAALVRTSTGWVAAPDDALRRTLLFYDSLGSIRITVTDSRNASWIGRYHNAIKWLLETGDDSKLQPFKGRGVIDVTGRLHPFITDPETIRRLARPGQFRFDSIY